MKIIWRAISKFLCWLKSKFDNYIEINSYQIKKIKNPSQKTTSASVEFIGEIHEKNHYELAKSGNFKRNGLIYGDEIKMYNALISRTNKINIWRYAICPQASLGELFYVEGHWNDEATRRNYQKIYNSKRADIAIVDKDDGFKPVALIEIIGAKHDLRGKLQSKYRDETVKEICNKTNVRYHTFFEKDDLTPDQWIQLELEYLMIK